MVEGCGSTHGGIRGIYSVLKGVVATMLVLEVGVLKGVAIYHVEELEVMRSLLSCLLLLGLLSSETHSKQLSHPVFADGSTSQALRVLYW